MKCVCTGRLMYYLGQSDHKETSLTLIQNATLTYVEKSHGYEKNDVHTKANFPLPFSTDCVNMVKGTQHPTRRK